MNSLSWFIYLIGVVDNFRDCIFSVMFIGGFFGIAIGGIINAVAHNGDLDKIRASWWPVWAKRYVVFFFVGLFALTVLPERRTMLLIAASEIGQRIGNSQDVKDIVNPGLDLLKQWIKAETDKLANPKSK